ncbi:MAG: hypothetical protein ACYC97_00550 [Metallibacterium sp.]
MSARGRALRIAVLLAVAASAQAAAQRHPPRHFGRLTVARMGALANYTYAERLSAGMPGHLMTSVTHGWVHEAAFTADGSPSGVQASDNWRMQGSGMPGIAFVLARGKEWIVSPKGASTSEGSAVGSERHIATPRAMAQNFIDDLYNGVPQRQLHKLGVCIVAGKAGVLYGVWRPAAHAIASKACVQSGGGPILSYQTTPNPFGQMDWRLTQVGGVPSQLPKY